MATAPDAKPELASPPDGTAPSSPSYKVTLRANSLSMLISESSRGLVLPSLFAVCTSVSANSFLSPTSLLAACVASFSAGRLASSFLLAWMAGRGMRYTTILKLCFAVQLVSGTTYAIGGSLSGSAAAALVLVSRFVLGGASGTLPVNRSVVADVTSTSERTREMAKLSLAKFIGYAITPVISVVPGVGDNVPAWINVGFAVIGYLVIAVWFDTSLASAKPKVVEPLPATEDELVVLRSEGVCARAGRAWRETVHSFRSMSGAVLAALVTFFLINLTTKGALASAEAQLAPDFAESTELSDDSSELPAVLEENTAIFAIALGGVGLLAYVLVICKPKRGKRASGSGERAGLLAATSGAPPPRARCGWATTYADELDVWLLLASLLCTAVGALLLSGTPPLPIPILSAGMVLVWSLGGPVADVLSVSTVSIALSQLAPGSQAMSMAALSLAGSVGRIAWPLGVVWMGDTASSLASAAVCALSAVALVALLVRYPEMPGSAALRCCCGRRGGVYTQL